MNLWTVAVIIFFLNIPFGYWRRNVPRFSKGWALAVHIPVPFVIALRFIAGLGFQLVTYPVLVGAFFLGQLSGGTINSRMKQKYGENGVSSCMFEDFKNLRKKKAH